MGYHGIIWASMGFINKTVNFFCDLQVSRLPHVVVLTYRSTISSDLFICSKLKKCARRRVSRVLSRPRVRVGGDGHSSGTPVAERLVRPTRAAARRPARHPETFRDACRSYLVLLPVGFSLPPPLPAARCALTAPFHPCRPPGIPETGRRCTFCGTFPGVAPAGRYPAPHLRGARTFLSPHAGGERPSGRLALRDLGIRGPYVKGRPPTDQVPISSASSRSVSSPPRARRRFLAATSMSAKCSPPIGPQGRGQRRAAPAQFSRPTNAGEGILAADGEVDRGITRIFWKPLDAAETSRRRSGPTIPPLPGIGSQVPGHRRGRHRGW